MAADQRAAADTSVEDGTARDVDPKTGKRKLFGLGKKKDDHTMETTGAATGLMPHTQTAISAMQAKQPPVDLRHQQQPQPFPNSPSKHPYPSAVAAPSRLRSGSPRLHSPASSEIFERNVQEPVPISTLQGEMDPAHIATHVITEDHIPPALEASAQAITSEELNPDEVEIVMSASHQPAAASVLEGSASHADLTQLHPPTLQHQDSGESERSSVQQSGSFPHGGEDDGTSNYGQLDPNDFRRLSFISFADVVQSEQQHLPSGVGETSSRDNLHMTGFPPSIASVAAHHDRATSPGSTHSHNHSLSGGAAGVMTPPLGTANHADQSPVRIGSPAAASVQAGGGGGGHSGELHFETMRQAVRKTASGDLSGPTPMGALASPVPEEPSIGRGETRSRTNT